MQVVIVGIYGKKVLQENLQLGGFKGGIIRSINSKQKGKSGELELVHKLKDYGYDCRRTNQFCGNTGQADDVVGLDYIHIECKRVEKLNIDNAIEQAVRDTKDDKIPTVFHRKNRKDWLVTMKLDDFMKIYNEYYSSMKLAERKNNEVEK